MAIILKITDDNQVIIGMDDHTTITVSKNEFTFPIHESMDIDVYKHQDKYIFCATYAKFATYAEKDKNKVSVSKTAYGLLYLFLGSWGIHEFYAGNPKKAMLWILATLTMVFSTIIPIMISLNNGLYNIESHLDTIIALLFMTMAYNIFILVRSIITLCKPTGHYGNILVAKW